MDLLASYASDDDDEDEQALPSATELLGTPTSAVVVSEPKKGDASQRKRPVTSADAPTKWLRTNEPRKASPLALVPPQMRRPNTVTEQHADWNTKSTSRTSQQHTAAS